MSEQRQDPPHGAPHGDGGPPPTSARCPNLDAAAIYAVSTGEMNLRRPPRVATAPLEAGRIPAAPTPEGPYQPKQPERCRFDAADIFQLSLACHPWQAEPIQKAG